MVRKQVYMDLSFKTVSAQEAYALVLADVSAMLPRRDSEDTCFINDVQTGTATFDKDVVPHQDDVRGWPEFKSQPAPADGDDYTCLEEYLNATDPAFFVDYTKPENNVNILMCFPRL